MDDKGRDRLDYEWFYRTDGKGTFGKKEPNSFQAGKSSGDAIEFGPFRVSWSCKGFLYYSRFPGAKVQPGDLKICVTNETDIEKIDAADKKWKYKGSPIDPGE